MFLYTCISSRLSSTHRLTLLVFADNKKQDGQNYSSILLSDQKSFIWNKTADRIWPQNIDNIPQY